MDINVNVKIDVSDRVFKFLAAYTVIDAASKVSDAIDAALSKMQPVPKFEKGSPDHPGGPAIVGESAPETVTVPKGEKKTKVVKEMKAVPPAELKTAVADNVSQNGEEVTHEMIRNKVVALRDAGKKQQTVDLMTEYGLSGLSALDPALRPKFMQQLNQIG